MALSAGDVEFLIKLRDEMSAKINEIENRIGKFGNKMEEAGRKVSEAGMAITKLGLPLAALGAFSAKAAIDFESSMSNVKKTIGAAEVAAAGLEGQIRKMAKTLPFTTAELTSIAAVAGQFGVKAPEVAGFTKTIAALGVAVDGIAPEDAAAGLAKIGNVADGDVSKVDLYASALIHLGNNSASTEAEILEFARRLVGAGNTIGLTVPQVMALGTAMADVGINAEAGGTAMSTVMINMAKAVSEGGESLDNFASAANVSAEAFATAFKTKPVEAMQTFIAGLAGAEARGVDLIGMLDGLGVESTRMRMVLLNLANAGTAFNRALDVSNEAVATGNKHFIEAEQRYGTTASQLKILWNNVKDVAITLGQTMLPSIVSVTNALKSAVPLLDSAVKTFAALPAPIKASAFGFAALLVAAGPLTVAFGMLITNVGILVSTIATLWKAALAPTAAALTANAAAAASLAAAEASLTANTLAASAAASTRTTTTMAMSVATTSATASTLTMTGAVAANTSATVVNAAAASGLVGALKVLGPYVVGLAVVVWSSVKAWEAITNAVGLYNDRVDQNRLKLEQQKSDQLVLATAFKVLGLVTTDVSEATEALRRHSANLRAEQERLAKVTDDAVKQGKQLAPSIKSYADALAKAKDEVKNLEPWQRANIAAAKELDIETDKVAKTLKVSEAAVKLYGDQLDEGEKSQKKFDESLKKSREILNDWNEEVDRINHDIIKSMAVWSDFTREIERHTSRIGKSIIDMAVARRNYENELDALVRGRTMTRVQLEIAEVNRWAANEKLKLDQTVANWQGAADAIERIRIERIEFITEDDVIAQRVLFANLETDAARTATATAQTLKKTLMNTLMGIPQIIANTLANGGSWTEATAGIVSSIGTGLGALGGFLVGGPWGAAIGGAIGSLAGLVVEPISRIFGGVSRATREANEQLAELRTRLLQVHGGMEGLQAAAQRVGLSFTEAFMVQGERGLRMMNKMMADLEARTNAIKEATTQAVTGLAAVIETITGPWIAAGKAIGEATAATRQTLTDLGTQAMATFAAVLIQTGSFAEAIRAVGPSLATLAEAYRVLGVKVEDVGLQHLMLQSQILQSNPTLIAGIDGLSMSMQGLARMGLLNTETFAGMQRTGTEMYTRLQAAVFAAGGATRDALLPMQDYLHQAAAQAALLGIPLDANTQMLIDQSRELGIWREQGASATDRLIDGMSALVERVGALIDQLLGVSGAITAIPNRTVDVTVRTSYETIGEPDRRRDDEWSTGVPGFEGGTRGRLMDFGEGTMVELHGRERVQTAAEVAASSSGDPEEIARAIVAGLESYLPRAMARAMREAWQTA